MPTREVFYDLHHVVDGSEDLRAALVEVGQRDEVDAAGPVRRQRPPAAPRHRYDGAAAARVR
jgi:hypothetical protein